MRREIITILHCSKGFGHADIPSPGPGGLAEMTYTDDDDWDFGVSKRLIGKKSGGTFRYRRPTLNQKPPS